MIRRTIKTLPAQAEMGFTAFTEATSRTHSHFCHANTLDLS